MKPSELEKTLDKILVKMVYVIMRYDPVTDILEEDREAVDEAKTAILTALKDSLPKVSRYQSNGHLRAFSIKEVWDYADVYMKGEQNYRNKLINIINKKGQ